MNLIDCQSHVFSPEYMNLLVTNGGYIRAEQSGASFAVNFGDVQTLRFNLDDYSAEKKLADMDASGVSCSVISPNMPGPELLDPDLREPGARVNNDYIAELCASHPDRFAGLAVLPFTTPQATMAEYVRAIHTLNLRGVVLYSHINGRPVDSREFEDLYAAAAGDGIPLVLHPTVPTWGPDVRDHSMIPMMGFMVDHSFAMLRLILSGVLERHPTLKIVHPHCGGVLPYLISRVDEQTEVKGRGRDRITRAPSEYYRSVYLDIVAPSSAPATFALQFSGIERLLFASDHPWIPIDTMLEVFDAMGLNEADRQQIACRNAEQLFNIASDAAPA